jgi:hypothetical protein
MPVGANLTESQGRVLLDNADRGHDQMAGEQGCGLASMTCMLAWRAMLSI